MKVIQTCVYFCQLLKISALFRHLIERGSGIGLSGILQNAFKLQSEIQKQPMKMYHTSFIKYFIYVFKYQFPHPDQIFTDYIMVNINVH